MMPALAATLFGAACSDTTTPDTRALVRFVNATQDMIGNGGFTSNGQFISGSALGLGQASSSCTRMNAGSATFGFGSANAGGTGLSGSALATLAGQSMPEGGDFTLVATGSATAPALFLLDNALQGSLGANQAAVRFVNLAPGTGTSPFLYVIFLGEVGGNLIAANLATGVPSAFGSMTSGATSFSVLQIPGHNIAIPSVTHSLQPGSVNTLGVVPNAAGGVDLMKIPSCS